MKSTIYGDEFGAVLKNPSGSEEIPSSEIVVTMRPLFDNPAERIIAMTRIQGVTANAKLVYIAYAVRGEKAPQHVSLRATARELGMPFETFRRARAQLIECKLFVPVIAGHVRRILVQDIEEVTQNESVGALTQNESPRISHAMRAGPISLENSGIKKESLNATSISSRILSNNENRVVVGHETRIGDDIFADDTYSATDTLFAMLDGIWPPDSKATLTSPTVPARPPGPTFKLRPPVGPKSRKRRPRTSADTTDIPGWAFPKLFEVCFGVTTSKQQYALGASISGRVARALQNLLSLGADLSRLGEFLTWWKTWAKGRPSPETVVTFWLNAMEQIDASIGADTPIDPAFIARVAQQNEEWTPERVREFARGRARELGNPNA